MKAYDASRRTLFGSIDRPAMRELPSERFEYAEWTRARVAPDYHVTVDKHHYSVPFRLIGTTARGAPHRAHDRDLPRRRARRRARAQLGARAGTRRDRLTCPSRIADTRNGRRSGSSAWAANDAGPATARVVAQIMADKPHPEQGFRSALGVMRLGRATYGADRLEAACERATRVGRGALPVAQDDARARPGPPATARAGTGDRDAASPQHSRRELLRTAATNHDTHNEGDGMLTHPTIEQLNELQLRGMADALTEQQAMDLDDMSFEERLGLLVDREVTERDRRRLKTRLTQAKLRQSACIEDINFRARRGLGQETRDAPRRMRLDPPAPQRADLRPLRRRQELPRLRARAQGLPARHTALATSASVACSTTSRSRAPTARSPRLMANLARMHVLILDDFALTPPTEQGRRDLLEVIEDRHGLRSTIITSQLPVESWHDTLGEPTIADAILDRLVHNAHHINLAGDSMRRTAHAGTPTK